MILQVLVASILGLAAFVAVMLYLGQPKARPETALDRILAALAEAHEGLTLRLGTRLEHPVLEGSVDGIRVTITPVAAAQGEDHERLAIRLDDRAGLPPTLLHRAGGLRWATTVHLPQQARPLRCGDPAFEAAYVVRTVDAGPVLAALPAAVRARLVEDQGVDWRYEAGAWVGEVLREERPLNAFTGMALKQRAIGWDTIGERLPAQLARGLELVRLARGEGSVDERLRGLLEQDPEPGVRARALEALMARDAAPAALLRRVAAGAGLPAVVAAASVDDGEAHLVRLMGARDTRRAAALAATARGAALSEAARRAAQRALLQELPEKTGQLEVVDALGALADVAAVPTLIQARDVGVLGSREVVRRVDAAIRAIQGRAEGAGAGQVSLAATTGEAGRLSTAAGPRRTAETEGRGRG